MNNGFESGPGKAVDLDLYRWYHKGQTHSLVLFRCAKGFSTLQQKTKRRKVECTLQRKEGLDKHVSRQCPAVSDALPYFMYLLFDRLLSLPLTCDISTGSLNWKELSKYVQRGIYQPAVFCSLLRSVTLVLSDAPSRLTASQAIKPDE